MTKPMRIGLLLSVLLHAVMLAGLMSLPFFPAAPAAPASGLSVQLVMTAPATPAMQAVAADPVPQAAAEPMPQVAAVTPSPASKPAPVAPQPQTVSAPPANETAGAAPRPVDTGARDAYLQALAEQIRQQKYYPSAGRRLGEQGRVMVELVIDRDGQLARADVTQSSGFGRLDDAALEAVRSAAPFSPLPMAFPGDVLSLSVPMDFSLR